MLFNLRVRRCCTSWRGDGGVVNVVCGTVGDNVYVSLSLFSNNYVPSNKDTAGDRHFFPVSNIISHKTRKYICFCFFISK